MASDRPPQTAAARLRRAGLLLALALSTASTGLARPAQPGASDRETARNLMDIGREKMAAGEYDAALEAYQGADQIMSVPTTGLAVAEALIGLGRLIEAREKLLAVTRHAEADDEPKPFAAARSRARALSPELAQRIPSLRVEVLAADSERSLEGAHLRLDGESLDAAGLKLPRKLDPGKHTVAAEAPGFETTVKTIEIGEGEHHLVSLVLRASDGGAAPSVSEVSPLVWIGFGFTVAGAIAGAATGSAALAKSAALEDDCPDGQCAPDEQERIDSMDLMSHVSTVSFAVAGAGAVLGIVGIVLSVSGDAPDQELARIAPRLGPGFVGVNVKFW